MKQKIRLFLMLLITLSASYAQNIQNYYTEMPDELSLILTRKQRVELLEYYKASMGDSIKNRFGTKTQALELDTINNHILVQNTAVSKFEMKLFTIQKKPILAIIKTVCAPLCHSSINFYDKNWQELKIPYYKLSAWDWIEKSKLPQEKNEQKNIQNLISTSFISLTFAKEKDQIIAKNNSLEFLSTQEKEKIEPLLKKEDLVLELKKDAFVLEKKR